MSTAHVKNVNRHVKNLRRNAAGYRHAAENLIDVHVNVNVTKNVTEQCGLMDFLDI